MDNYIAKILGLTIKKNMIIFKLWETTYKLRSSRRNTPETLLCILPKNKRGSTIFTLQAIPSTHHEIALGEYLAQPLMNLKQSQAAYFTKAARKALAK